MSASVQDAGPVRHPRDLLFGDAQALSAEMPALDVVDLYEHHGAFLWDELTAGLTADLGPFVRAAMRSGGPVLDLGCGSGRSMLPMVQRGLRAVGVDLSASMLCRLDERLRVAQIEPSSVEMVQADMTTVQLGRVFPFVLCAATSVVLVPRSVRTAFFRTVVRHLAPGGTFLFDIVAHDFARLANQPFKNEQFSFRDESGGVHMVRAEHSFDVVAGFEDVNFIVEDAAASPMRIITTRKQLFERDAIHADLRSGGLEVVHVEAGTMPGLTDVEYITARRVETSRR